MKIVYLFMTIAACLFLIACSEKKSIPPPTENNNSVHLRLLSTYLHAQLSFKETIEAIEDEESFDQAMVKLNEVIILFDQVSQNMTQLDPPDEEDQRKFAQLIIDGNAIAEPTSGALIKVMTLENREIESAAWFSDFIRAGKGLREQFNRLYSHEAYITSAKAAKIKRQIAEEVKIQIDAE